MKMESFEKVERGGQKLGNKIHNIILQWDSLIGPTQEKFESVDTRKSRSIHSKQPIGGASY